MRQITLKHTPVFLTDCVQYGLAQFATITCENVEKAKPNPEGDYYTIVGLPISKVAEKLTVLGVETSLSPQS